jgi:ABC-type glutathione transport system ATPase component
MSAALLRLFGVDIDYRVGSRVQHAVRGVSLDVRPGEVMGLIGESGSGKSTLMMGLLGGLPPGGVVSAGRIDFEGEDLARSDAAAWRRLRWKRLAYVPQGALNALNPVLRLEEQFAHILRDHGVARGRRTIRRVAAEALAAMNLDERVLDRFPHELSGGMRQRVCVAMAVLLSPALIVADEPTSALDVVSQRLVIDALAAIREEKKCSVILVGHDLALQSEIADRIAILFSGRLLELGPADAVFAEPAHPYTQRLVASIPRLDDPAGLPEVQAISDAERRLWGDGAAPLAEIAPGHFVAPLPAEAGP